MYLELALKAGVNPCAQQSKLPSRSTLSCKKKWLLAIQSVLDVLRCCQPAFEKGCVPEATPAEAHNWTLMIRGSGL
jgi:hypothetical protein